MQSARHMPNSTCVRTLTGAADAKMLTEVRHAHRCAGMRGRGWAAECPQSTGAWGAHARHGGAVCVYARAVSVSVPVSIEPGVHGPWGPYVGRYLGERREDGRQQHDCCLRNTNTNTNNNNRAPAITWATAAATAKATTWRTT
jgi:hypothetical protein